MHHDRMDFACAAVARCIIVVGTGMIDRHVVGSDSTSKCEVYDEVYDEVDDRWLQLPCHFPGDVKNLQDMGSALV
jgi:hypothetical protein